MDTKNRKHSVLVISLLIVVTAGVFVFMYREKIGSWTKKITGPAVEAGPYDKLLAVKCEFEDDGAAFKAALEKVNPESCSCIEAEESKKYCFDEAFDILNFQQIVKRLDAERCKELRENDRKSCADAIAGRIASMAKHPEALATNYLESGNYDKAAEILNNSGNKDVDNLLLLALVYANQGLAQHQETDFVPKALALVDRALAIKADNPEAYRVQGYIFEVKLDLEAAVLSYSRAIEIDPGYILAYVGRGHAQNMQMRLPDALADFIKAKELDKGRKYPQVYEQLCRLEKTSPMLEAAIEDCMINASLVGVASRSQAHGMLAELFVRAEKFVEAENQIKQALIYAPDDLNALVVAARVYSAKGDYVMAADYARQAMALDGTKSTAYSQLAQALAKQKQADKAIETALKGLSLVDADISVLNPNKDLVKKELADLLADLYGQKGDTANVARYREYLQTEQQRRSEREVMDNEKKLIEQEIVEQNDSAKIE